MVAVAAQAQRATARAQAAVGGVVERVVLEATRPESREAERADCGTRGLHGGVLELDFPLDH